MEHDSFKESDCLCGRGQVTRHVSSTDYMFGSADVSYSLDCSHCAKEWRYEHKSFVERSSEQRAEAVYQELKKVWKERADVFPPIIDAYFVRKAFRTKKDELAEIERLGFRVGNYRSYTTERRNGRSPGQIAHVASDGSGLIAIAEESQRPHLKHLLERDVELRQSWEATGKKVVRRRAPS